MNRWKNSWNRDIFLRRKDVQGIGLGVGVGFGVGFGVGVGVGVGFGFGFGVGVGSLLFRNKKGSILIYRKNIFHGNFKKQ